MDNILYKDVIINHDEMANWEDEFLPKSIEDNIILSPFDHCHGAEKKEKRHSKEADKRFVY